MEIDRLDADSQFPSTRLLFLPSAMAAKIYCSGFDNFVSVLACFLPAPSRDRLRPISAAFPKRNDQLAVPERRAPLVRSSALAPQRHGRAGGQDR